jgi:hypothetical protein
MLTKDDILKADDLPREEVACPEWGGSVFVRVMSGTERDRFEGAYSRDAYNDTRARLAALTVCDAEGRPLFSEADIPSLGRKSSAVLDRIFDVAKRLNALSGDDVDRLEKNS